MPENNPATPPPLPGTEESPPSPQGARDFSFSVVISGVVTAASVIYLAFAAIVPERTKSSADQDRSLDPQEANELAILKLQSRLAIGLVAFNPIQGEQLVKELDQLASAPRSRVALAIVHSFIGKDQDRALALEILAKVQDGEASGKEKKLAEVVRQGIESGASQAESDFIARELGWFSRLVPPVKKSADFGRDIRNESSRTMIVLGIFMLGAFFVIITGIVLLVLFLILRGNGSLRMRFQPTLGATHHHLFLEIFAVYIGIMALGHLLGTLLHEAAGIVAYGISFLLALAWPKWRGYSWKDVRRMIGWSRGKGLLREVGAGFVGYAVTIAIACGGLVLTLIIVAAQQALLHTGDAPGGAQGSHPIVGMLDSARSLQGQLFLLFFAAGVAPFFEETMFRGALFRFLRCHRGFLVSALAGGLIFAVIHPQGLIAVPALAGMGIGFALLREWRDSLIASMTAHAVNNGAIVILVLVALS